MQETKARLTKELADVCREYYLEVWTKALNVVGAPTNSKLRKAKNVFYPEDLREVLEATPQEAPLAPIAAEQPAPSQAIPPLPEATKEPGKASNHGRGAEVAKSKEADQSKAQPEDKGKGKEAALKAKESELVKPLPVAQEKKATNPPALPPVSKEDPPPSEGLA